MKSKITTAKSKKFYPIAKNGDVTSKCPDLEIFIFGRSARSLVSNSRNVTEYLNYLKLFLTSSSFLFVK
jgi:hypothetical protein